MTANWGGNHELLVTFVRRNAIDRKFHTYFDWETGKPNKFFALFGETFKQQMLQRCREDQAFDAAAKAFVELGSERNRLVHQDFGSFTLEKRRTTFTNFIEGQVILSTS